MQQRNRDTRITGHRADVACPKCGRLGVVAWDGVSSAGGYYKEKVRIQGDFHTRESNMAPFGIDLICNMCGTIQANHPA
jgi:hypothetical protein